MVTRAGTRARILELNYYQRPLNARVILNMARAALIKEREFRRAWRVHLDKSRRATRRSGPSDTGGQKCTQKIAANLNC